MIGCYEIGDFDFILHSHSTSNNYELPPLKVPSTLENISLFFYSK